MENLIDEAAPEVTGRPKRLKYPSLRPDQCVFRSWRAGDPPGTPPPASWHLLEINGAAVRAARDDHDLTQEMVAQALSSEPYEYGQEEISRLEHEPEHCWVNYHYARNLAFVLEVDWRTIIVNPPSPARETSVVVWEHAS